MINELTNHPKITLFLLTASLAVFLLILVSPQNNSSTGPDKTSLKSSVYERLVPGKATEKDVVKLLGKPSSIEEGGGKTYYTYATESVNFNNTIVFREGRVYYSVENFFGNYIKSPTDYTKTYGQPELTLYDPNNDTLEWFVFLGKGVGIARVPFENLIIKVLYFSPQTRPDAEQILTQELGLIREKAEAGIVEEVVAPGY